MSEGGGKVEMVAEMATECFCRGKHPEAERRRPRNSINQDRKFTLGEANGETMLPAETEDLSEVIYLEGEILAKD